MTPICTYEDHNLGDQLIFLHLLRALAKANPSRVFWHFTHALHCEQLVPVVADLPNIELFSFDSEQWRANQRIALNVWKNMGATDTRLPHRGPYKKGFWEKSKNRSNWSAFTLEHHAHVASRLGLRSPFTIRENLLFDYPALNPNGIGGTYFYDALFVNSEPCSGQFKPMQEHGNGYLNEIIQQVAKKYRVITTNPVLGVECTRDTKQSVTDIGRLSLLCRHHICVATGPMWTTFSTTNHHHNEGRLRVALLDNEETLEMPNIQQCATREELIPLLKKYDLL
jgi:hypothetical protein